MNYFGILLSVALISICAIDSPFLILKNWSEAELLRASGIFLLLYGLSLICKRFNAANGWLILALVIVILTHFDIASCVALCLIGFVATVLGSEIYSWSKVKWIGSEDFTINISVGYALMLGVIQITSHFNINTREFVTVVCIIILLSLRSQAKNLLARMWQAFQEPYNQQSIQFVLPVGVALCMLVFVAMPETHSDALIVNLRIAHQMQINGFWPFDAAAYSWAYWPKGAAWLQTLHYLIAGESGARLFNWLAIIITSLMIYSESVRLGFAKNIGMAIALFLSTPITFWCGFVLFDDAVFGMFVTAAIIAAVNSSRSFAPSGIFATLLLCSAAMATKITGVMLIPVVLTIYAGRYLLEKKDGKSFELKWSITSYLIIFIPFLFIGLFSYLIAYLKTGNPVLPLYNDIFKSSFYPPQRFQDLRWLHAIEWNFIYDLTANTSKFMEGNNWTFGVQHALFFIPLIFEVITRRRNNALVLYGLGLAVFATLLFTQTRYARYLYPIFPIFTIFIASVLCRFDSGIGRLLATYLTIAVVAVNLLNVKSLNMFYSFDFKSMTPVETRSFSDYAERSLNQTVNIEYGRSSRVLYFHPPYSSGLDGVALINHWASPKIIEAISSVQSIKDAMDLMRKFEITHVILNKEVEKNAPHQPEKYLPEVANLQRQIGSSQLWKVDRELVASREVLKLNDRFGKTYLSKGWRAPEYWGTWAFGADSGITVRLLNHQAKSPVLVKVLAMPYNPPGRVEGLRVKVAANGYPLKQTVLLPLQEQQAINFTIPAEFIGESGVIKLTFQYSAPFDSGELQLGFMEISFDYE